MVFGGSPLSLCQRMQEWQVVGAQDSAGIKVRGLEVTG